jgi:hypothetical protein
LIPTAGTVPPKETVQGCGGTTLLSPEEVLVEDSTGLLKAWAFFLVEEVVVFLPLNGAFFGQEGHDFFTSGEEEVDDGKDGGDDGVNHAGIFFPRLEQLDFLGLQAEEKTLVSGREFIEPKKAS